MGNLGISKIFTITAIIAISGILLASIGTNQIVFADPADKEQKSQDKAIKKAQKAQDKADKKQAKADKEQDKADKAQAKADNAPPEKQVKEQKKADKKQAKADKKQDKADKEQAKSCKKIQKESDKLTKKGFAIPDGLTTIFTDNCVDVPEFEDLICTGSVGGLTVNNLIVPQGATCTMDQFNLVLGNITVEDNATLFMCADNDVLGNVVAGAGTKLFLRDKLFSECTAGTKSLGINIGGDITQNDGANFTLEGNSSPTAEFNIQGNIEITNTRVRIINVDNQGIQGFVKITGAFNTAFITGNTFNDNLEIIDFNGALLFVQNNSIDGDLLISGTTGGCFENGNTVAGITDSCP